MPGFREIEINGDTYKIQPTGDGRLIGNSGQKLFTIASVKNFFVIGFYQNQPRILRFAQSVQKVAKSLGEELN